MMRLQSFVADMMRLQSFVAAMMRLQYFVVAMMRLQSFAKSATEVFNVRVCEILQTRYQLWSAMKSYV